MEEIVKSLSQMGGLGICAAAMFWLHVTSIRSFREELEKERTGFLERNRAVVDALREQTAILSQRFDALAETLREIEKTHYGRGKPTP
jgi:hypothetical protein